MEYAVLQRNGRKISAPEIAVHLHLFYVEQLDDLLQRLQNLAAYPYDLFVTMVNENAAAKQKILAFKPDAQIWLVPNYGYDIGPFIDFLHQIDLDAYKYIIKIHTKRLTCGSYCYVNHHRFCMDTWRKMMLDAVLSPAAVANNLQLLQNNPAIGLIGCDYVMTDEKKAYCDIEEQVAAEMSKLGFTIPTDKHFIAGTMFWARAELLKPFLTYKIADFATSADNVHDKTLAHTAERMFGLVMASQGYQIKGVHYKNYFWHFIAAGLCRFIFQKKITRNGTFIIKICKIPVYYKRGKV